MCSLAAMPEMPAFRHRPHPQRYLSLPPPPPPPSSPQHTRPSPAKAPSRPCLASPPPRSAKKKVVFADDKGYSLTQVRVMREPSFLPPSWSVQFLARLMRDLQLSPPPTPTPEAAPEPADTWVTTFPQPASDYLRFRQRLDSANVSLENVIVRAHEGVFTGTVKVRNLAFDKDVTLRWTADAWASHADEACRYVEPAATPCGPAVSYSLYDTFSFRAPLPAPPATRVEFCVRFRCGGQEFWDSADGGNYALERRPAAPATPPAAPPPPLGGLPAADAGKWQDALRAQPGAWSEFASWNHLLTEGPYW